VSAIADKVWHGPELYQKTYIPQPKKKQQKWRRGHPAAQAQPPQDDRMHRGFVALPV